MGDVAATPEFWDLPKRTKEEWDALTLEPLVKKGEDAKTRIDEIVTQWCTPSPAGDYLVPEKHASAGGFVLDGLDLVDANTAPLLPSILGDFWIWLRSGCGNMESRTSFHPI